MRIALGIEYDGRAFYGWQTQRQEPTVQATLERALSKVANHPVSVICAGRTDTGVHARCQVVHFDTNSERQARSWILGANANLPSTVCVLWAQPVPEEFHARFTALGRRYCYRLLNRWVRPAVDAGLVSWERQHLDADAMNEAAQALVGEHDFSAFRSAGCRANHPVRTIREISVRREGEHVDIEVAANAFLYHMVRNIAGTLLPVGRGERPVDWVAEVLHGKDRTRAGVTAMPDGLYFMSVRYPAEFGLPEGVPTWPQGSRPE
ncbi:tRNA pseudouridine(38-40) synthase TruA [Marinihelvus fidelis]|uniref:tRNA pseudouridine synthase A n=1 Tax=Marinihelvus fidelis TaxID=2613842 RepID=A0A5N0TFM8_9GAMM|nr:tRNA pseudouridine(38-40) synthase TruA [Marinihelvus fidelis]KAA9132069.1 tRNA pseudouridine(38-40) synthase TruA [Marinihelvus fidelis]